MLQRLLSLMVLIMLPSIAMAQDDNLPNAPPQAQQRAADTEGLVPPAAPAPAPTIAETADIKQLIVQTIPIAEAGNYLPADQLPDKAAYIAEAIPDMWPALRFLGYAVEKTQRGFHLYAAVASLNGRSEVLFCFNHNDNCNRLNTTARVTQLLAATDLIDFDGFQNVLLRMAQTQEIHLRKLESGEELALQCYRQTMSIRKDAMYEVLLEKSVSSSAVSFRR